MRTQAISLSNNFCRCACAAWCSYVPKCIFTDGGGVVLLCRNSVSLLFYKRRQGINTLRCLTYLRALQIDLGTIGDPSVVVRGYHQEFPSSFCSGCEIQCTGDEGHYQRDTLHHGDEWQQASTYDSGNGNDTTQKHIISRDDG